MTLRNEILNLLAQTNVTEINFLLPGTVRINGARFTTVANAITGYTVQVIHNPNLRNHTRHYNGLMAVAGSEYDALYDSAGNCFVFSQASIAGNMHLEALTVHEAVHASLDLNRVALVASDDEAAAYIAQCVYLTRRGFSYSGSSQIFTRAFAAAVSIQGGHGVTVDMLNALRTAIENDPAYHNIPAVYLRNG
jgi:hypothetical protein